MRKLVTRGLLVLSPLSLAAAMTASAGPVPPSKPSGGEGLHPAVMNAMQRDLGLTGAEVSQYLGVERLAAMQGKKLAQAQGEHFAGSWIERTPRGFELVVATTANKATRTPRGATVRLVDDTFAELNLAKAQLDGAVQRKGKAPKGVHGWFVDVRNNSVTINVAPGARQAAIDFVARTDADIGSVRFETMASQPRPLATLQGGSEYLSNDGSSYYYCSVGFAVTKNGAKGFATAGHCGAAGDRAFVAVNRRTVSQIGAFAASSFPNGDKAWVQVDNAHNIEPVVDGYGSGDIPVHGSTEAPIGAAVCRSGRTTGMHCGVIEAKNVTVQYPDTAVGGLTQVKVCAEGGDSGGSFITNAGQAQGVLSGGNYSCKGKQAKLATSYFQPINPLLQQYGLDLVVQ